MSKIKNYKHDYLGFTLLEVMIAISIFGFLMVYVAQFTRSEIKTFESVSRQNNVEQKARSSMMHILDEIRLNHLTVFDGTYKITSTDPDIPYACLINVTPDLNSLNPPSAEVFLANDKLWYRSSDPTKPSYLIADEIMTLTISEDDDDPQLVQIHIIAGDTSKGSKPYELRTWIGLN